VSDNIIGTVMIRAGNDCHPPHVVYVEGKSTTLIGGYVLNVLNENRNALAYRNELTELDLQGFEIDKERWNIAQSEKRLNQHQMRLKALTDTTPTEEPQT
jgi:hypothetical protein